MNAIRDLFSRIRTRRFLVLGDVILDHYIWGDATRISPEAPVPVVEIFRDTWSAGGAANVALNLHALGASVSVAGAIGDDDSGRRLRTLLQQVGVAFRPFSVAAQTITKTRVLVQNQQLCRLDRESEPGHYALGDDAIPALVEEELETADAVIFSDYAKGMITSNLVNRVVSHSARKPTFVAMDPKPKRYLDFRGIDLLTPNRREAMEMADLPFEGRGPFPAEEVCSRIQDRYAPKNLVVTLGDQGMLLCAGGKVLKTIPTVARQVFDVSGAGDTSIAFLTAGLAAGADLETSAQLANAAAGVVVGKIGTATALPDEIIASLEGSRVIR